MPDISMCNNQECEKRLSCYRFIAEPEELMQSYLIINGNVNNCEYYWKYENNA